MIVISDSTPLISLMKAVRLEILEPLFGEVFIPEAVFSELTVNPKYAVEAELISNSSFIRVVSVKEKKAVDILRRTSGWILERAKQLCMPMITRQMFC